MSKTFLIWILCCLCVCVMDCNPIHDLRLDSTFIHEFSENLFQNITELMASNSYTDSVGHWQVENQRDIHKCVGGLATNMWLISLPYIKMTTKEMNWPDHRVIWINVKCLDGHTIPLTVDFSQSKGARRRFGFFNHNKIVLRGPDQLNLPVKKVYQATNTTKVYNLRGYNCHHYADETYQKLLVVRNAMKNKQ